MTSYLKTSNLVTVVFLIAMCWHFGTVLGLFGAAPIGQSDTFIRIGIIVGLTILVAVGMAFFHEKRQGSPLLPDEREEKIERFSEGSGVLTIYAGLLVLAWFAFTPLSPAQFVNGILAVVTVTELVKLLVVLFLHRRKLV